MNQHVSTLTAPRTPWLGVFSRRDLLWVFGAVLPPFAYALVLKVQRLGERRVGIGTLDWASLFTSDLAIFVMWAALALGMRALATRPWQRVALGAGLQLLLGLYVALLLGAQGYFMATGASLDHSTLVFALENLHDTRKVIASASSSARWAAFFAVEVALFLLPWLFAQRGEGAPPVRRSSRALGFLLSYSVAGLALGFAMTRSHESAFDLARDPFAHLLATVGHSSDEESDPAILAAARTYPRGPETLIKGENGGKKNLVIILLESTGASVTSLYGEYDTTPFMKELAERAIVAEHAYTVVPHTSKAIVSSLCGIEPRPGVEMVEALENGIPGKCLAALLAEQGYRTAMLQAAVSEFENRPQLVRNMGFQELIAGEHMNARGLQVANYFGYEDRILLEPTRNWLKKHGNKGPFFLAYLTNTPHHDYLGPRHYGWVQYVENKAHNRYLNTIRYQDFFLRDLFAEFEKAGKLRDTVFVIVGDHGEAFAQHGLSGHDNLVYDECLRVPLLVIDPERQSQPARLPGFYSQLDIAPTVLEALGFSYDEGGYVGRSLFAPYDPQRVLYGACLPDKRCLGRIQNGRKLVHTFGRKADEFYDLVADPDEFENLRDEFPGEVRRARADALAWYRTIRAVYRPALERADSEYISDEPPKIDNPRRIRFGDIEYLGWSSSPKAARLGDWVTITYYFHVLADPPKGTKLFMFAEDERKTYRWDHVPVHRMYPEHRWRAGQYLADPYRTKIAKGWRREKVVVRGGFTVDGRRVPSSPSALENAPILAELPIEGRSDTASAASGSHKLSTRGKNAPLAPSPSR